MAILARYHANGDVNDELVQDEFYQICKSINAEEDFFPSYHFQTILA
jgi:hypothetical protein